MVQNFMKFQELQQCNNYLIYTHTWQMHRKCICHINITYHNNKKNYTEGIAEWQI